MMNIKHREDSTVLPLEWPACPVCQVNDPQPVRTFSDLSTGHFVLVQCGTCGVHYLRPRPAPAALQQCYPDDYQPFRRRGLMARAFQRALRQEVHELWPVLAPPRHVLDVGCGDGTLLQLIRETGNPNVVGLEPSHSAVHEARRRFQLDIYEGTLEATPWPAGSFDTVLLRHVLEHLADPSHAIQQVRSLLRLGGHVVIWTPNLDSWAAQLLGRYWIGYDPPRHLVIFSAKTLQALLKREGFSPINVRHEWYGLEWAWALRLWLQRHWGTQSLVARTFGRLHPGLVLASTPISAAAAICQRSGRIRIVAQWQGPRTTHSCFATMK